MEDALVFLDARDIGHLPTTERSKRGHQDVSNVFDLLHGTRLRVGAADAEVPFPSLLIVGRMGDFMRELNVAHDLVLLGNIFNVLADFRPGREVR